MDADETQDDAAPGGLGRLLTSTEAARRLGINRKTLRKWADDGYIPHIKTPTRYRLFDPAVLDEFMRKMRMEPTGKLAA